MKLKPEELECQAYVEWFSLQYPAHYEYLIHVPNERADQITRLVLASLGVKPGVQDYLLFEPRGGHPGMALEMKRPDAGLSSVTRDQRKWATRLHTQGWFTALAFGFDQAREITAAYMAERLEPRHWFTPGAAAADEMIRRQRRG